MDCRINTFNCSSHTVGNSRVYTGKWVVYWWSGVPQGSVLSPLLFLVAVNDSPDNVKTHVACYADDTTLSISEDIQSVYNLLCICTVSSASERFNDVKTKHLISNFKIHQDLQRNARQCKHFDKQLTCSARNWLW